MYLKILLVIQLVSVLKSDYVKCEELNKYQYFCEHPKINPDTQQPETCRPDNSINLICKTSVEIDCLGSDSSGYFNKTVPAGCDYNTHKSYPTAVLLAIFCGFLGLDRFYLGYYAIGLLKMFTLGGVFIFWLVDVVLIILQIVGPADGTAYFMAYFGPKVTPNRFNEYTSFAQVSCIEC